MSHDEMNCRRLILEYLVDYEDGSMPASERAALEEHLSHCPPCVVFLHSYRATGRTLPIERGQEKIVIGASRPSC